MTEERDALVAHLVELGARLDAAEKKDERDGVPVSVPLSFLDELLEFIAPRRRGREPRNRPGGVPMIVFARFVVTSVLDLGNDKDHLLKHLTKSQNLSKTDALKLRNMVNEQLRKERLKSK